MARIRRKKVGTGRALSESNVKFKIFGFNSEIIIRIWDFIPKNLKFIWKIREIDLSHIQFLLLQVALHRGGHQA